MATQISNNLQVNAPKSIDSRYGKADTNGVTIPYVSVSEANANILSTRRFEGLTIFINLGDGLKEYWYLGGTADNNLVLKTTSGSGTVTVDDAPTNNSINPVSSNGVFDALINKADVDPITGIVSLDVLPGVFFQDLQGSGTSDDPFRFVQQQASAEDYLKSLPGFDVDKILYSDLTWGPIPAGNLEKLATPTIVFGSASVNGVPMSWTPIINASTYQLQRSTNPGFSSVVTLYTGPAYSFTDSSLSANTTYYFRLKASSSGFTPSDFGAGMVTTPATGNITPPTPTNGLVNDTANTFNWTNANGYGNVSSYEFTLDGGSTYSQLTAKPLVVGDVSLDVNMVGVRVKADVGRDAGGTLFNTVAFIITPITPPAPTNAIVDNTLDTFDWTNSVGYDNIFDYEYVLDGGTNWLQLTEKPISVGDVEIPVNNVRVRVKAAAGRNASAYISNASAFVLAPELGIALNNFTYLSNLNSTGNEVSTNTFDGFGGAGALAYSITSGNTGWLTQEMRPFSLSGEGGTGVLSAGIGLDPFYGASDSIAFISGTSLGMITRKGGNTGNGVVSTGSLLRLRIELTTVYTEYSLDGGSTYIVVTSVSRPAGTIRFKVGFAGNQYKMHNIRGFNLTAL